MANTTSSFDNTSATINITATPAINATATVVSSSTPVPINVTTAAVGNATVTTESQDDEGIGKVVLIGGIAGGVVGFIIILIIIILCIRRHRAKKDDDDDDEDDTDFQPQPLPKLDAYGRVIPNGTDSADTVHPNPRPPEDGTHIPTVYENPDQPSTRAHITDSGKHHYGNIPYKNDSSSGSLPSYPAPPPPSPRGGNQNNCFDWRRDGSPAQQGEEPYMPMNLCNPLEPRTGRRQADPSRPSPCTPKKKHGYVNTPSGTPQSSHRTGYQDYQDEEQHHYGNVDSPAHRPVLGAAASSGFSSPSLSPQVPETGSRYAPWEKPSSESKPSSKPVLRISPMPSPQPSSKWEHETSFSSSPKASPKTPHEALKPPAKLNHRVKETESPKPSPKPPLKPGKLRANSVDAESDSENYMNLKAEPDDDDMNAPDKTGDYVNAPNKKRL